MLNFKLFIMRTLQNAKLQESSSKNGMTFVSTSDMTPLFNTRYVCACSAE